MTRGLAALARLRARRALIAARLGRPVVPSPEALVRDEREERATRP